MSTGSVDLGVRAGPPAAVVLRETALLVVAKALAWSCELEGISG